MDEEEVSAEEEEEEELIVSMTVEKAKYGRRRGLSTHSRVRSMYRFPSFFASNNIFPLCVSITLKCVDVIIACLPSLLSIFPELIRFSDMCG